MERRVVIIEDERDVARLLEFNLRAADFVVESAGTGAEGLAMVKALNPDVVLLDLATGKSQSVFRQKDRRVTDTAVFTDGPAFLAAVEPPGRLRSAPIPGKVRILTSMNMKDWTEMPVDYRAVAESLILAGPDAHHLWAATDTGMILHLVP